MTIREEASFGSLVRGYRRALGLTQEELAERAGLSDRTVRAIERGSEHVPRADTVQLLADALELQGRDREAFHLAAGKGRGAETEGPIPPTAEISLPTHIPSDLTPFIGRDQEIRDVMALLQRPGVRLLTLTGPGGIGKTRLVLQVSRRLRERFSDGIVFVALAPVTDPDLVALTIASGLGVTEASGAPLRQTLLDHLRNRRLLLVLDNFEHLLAAATLLADLLTSCPALTVVVTSRSVLHLAAEHVYVVPPLSVPDPEELPACAALVRSDAVELFLERAQAARADFALSSENAAAVVAICHGLEGLPLAIVLAAARIRLFPPQALLERLSQRLQFLTGGPRDVPTRQQTLRGTIDWSYSLISPQQQRLVTRLSVFAGGCSLEAAEAVCNPEGDLDLIEDMTALIDQSLVRQEGEQVPHFVMLETVREYARERLDDHEDPEVTRLRYARYYLTMAEEAEPPLWGPDPGHWLSRMGGEDSNVMEVLRWAHERGQREVGLRLASALWPFWEARGRVAEGQRWLTRLLDAGSSSELAVPLEVEIKALNAVLWLTWMQDCWEAATELATLLLSRYQVRGDRWGEAYTLACLGYLALLMGQPERATELSERAVAVGQEVRDDLLVAFPLLALTRVAQSRGDQHWSRQLYMECFQLLGTRNGVEWLSSLRAAMTVHEGIDPGETPASDEPMIFYRALGLYRGILNGLRNAALGAELAGDNATAARMLEEGLGLARQVNRSAEIGPMLQMLGVCAAQQGNYDRATALAEERLALARAADDMVGVAGALLSLSDLARDLGDADRTIALAGESLALFREIGGGMQIGFALHNLGVARGLRGEHEEAVTLLEESLCRLEGLPGAAEVLVSLAREARNRGDLSHAVARSAEALKFIQCRFDVSLWPVSEWNIAAALEMMSSVRSMQSQEDRAARLLGAAEAIRARIGVPVQPIDSAHHAHHVEAVRSTLGEERCSVLWEQGRAMSLREAVAYALEGSA